MSDAAQPNQARRAKRLAAKAPAAKPGKAPRRHERPAAQAGVRGGDGTPRTVLVLQGGGALGAYQGGVFERLEAHGHQPDWVVGTSIGAINGAIIAGNPPERRLERLRAFWRLVAQDTVFDVWNGTPFSDWLRPWAGVNALFDVLVRGVPGFFEPRPGGWPDIDRDVPTPQTSFYDTGPLRATLQRLVDFDYLNAGHVRCTVCAVQVDTGALAVFDSAKQRLGPEHVMASGALPPGFPPVVIDGKAYWDGGIYSNTPLDIVMDDVERADTLCFMVDLWDPTEAAPRSIRAAMTRHKDIQYASRTSEHIEDHRRMQNMRRAIRLLGERLSAAERADPAVAGLLRDGCGTTINVVRLIMKAAPSDDHTKDIDFARPRLEGRWAAGVRDADRALGRRDWLAPVPPDVGMVVHELVQQPG